MKTWVKSLFLVIACGSLPLAAFTQESPISVGPQYDSSHVYVAPGDVDRFATSFLGLFGGSSSKQVIATVTPTQSFTSSQILHTPNGTVSLFGFTTPIPYPFGEERTGLLVTDIDAAVKRARSCGAEVVVSTFDDPIGRDAIVRFPGGVVTQLYWHKTKPSYEAFVRVPENRVYISPDSADRFLESFLTFSGGHIVSDTLADGVEFGRPGYRFRRILVESGFGRLLLFVTDGALPYPFGRETTGYEVEGLEIFLKRAASLGITQLGKTTQVNGRTTAMIRFPGGYIAELHQTNSPVR